MRTKITLFLLLLNVVLFFFIFGVERKWQTEKLIEEAKSRVLGPEAANIQQLEITSSSLENPVRLGRQGDNWKITSPYEWPANPHAVSRIVNELQFLEHVTSYEVEKLGTTDLSLATYGLESPNLTVSFVSGNGENAIETSLAIGNRTEIGQRLYVLSPDGTRVHVVADTLANSLSLDLDQLRANACFTIPVFEVRSLNLQNDGPANVRVRLRREGNGWRFESPVVTRASKTLTEVAINQIAALRTAEFLGAPSRQPDLVATAGTDAPSLRITLEGNNRRETLLLGDEVATTTPSPNGDLQFYAQMEDRDAIFTVTVPQLLATNLRNAQRELREETVLDLQGRQIDAITLTDDENNEVVLQKLDTSDSAASGVISSWQVVTRQSDGGLRTEPADATVVEQELLRNLRLLRATNFERDVPTDAELERWGLLARPKRTITLTFQSSALGAANAAEDVTLLIGTNQTEDAAYAKTQRETFVYAVDKVILDQTPVAALHYRERLLRELPAGARITGITLEDESDAQTVYSHTLAPEETWDDIFNATAEPLRGALTQLHESLRTLRASRIVADAFAPTANVNGQSLPWRYRLTVNLSLSGDEGEQAETFELFLAERDGGDRQLVGSPELEIIFGATPELIDAIWTLTYAERDPGPTEFTTPPEASAPDA
ncbi:MAG: hypothetical protein SynsKO_29890 [Synoicihabitans sp.]